MATTNCCSVWSTAYKPKAIIKSSSIECTSERDPLLDAERKIGNIKRERAIEKELGLDL
jgi:hypothetical protein